MRYAALALAAGLLFACSGDSGPSHIEAEGSWLGHFTTSGGTNATLAFTITETSGTVSGNGTLTAPGTALAQEISGTYSSPTLSLSLHTDGFSDANLTATVGEESMTGTLNGSGFTSQAVVLNRQ